ncbi:hypothetical protein Tco_1475377 [Tanacetum coccineum]
MMCGKHSRREKNRLNNDQQAETVEEIDHLSENNVITLDNINTSDDIVTSPTPQSVGKLPTKSKSKKRKVDEEDPYQDKIANSLDNIVHALDRNSKGEIYQELKFLGLERGDLHLAYAFLLENPVKTRGLFSFPIQDRMIYLKATMGLGDSEDFDTRG